MPPLVESELAEYYAEFYWENRDSADGQHIPAIDRPNETQVSLARDRLAWLARFVDGYGSALDFGAGDCAATYVLKLNQRDVHVVDPSRRAQELAGRYGATYSGTLEAAPVVDMIYSAHSIEHVADLRATVACLIEKVRNGGYLFFETPNVDLAVFSGMGHTPHTYMLSEESFRMLAGMHGMELIALEVLGPPWNKTHPAVVSDARSDLRVLLRKPASASAASP